VSVRVENLHFAYRRLAVLENIAFRADAGQLVAILGPNGSGKTTLLKTINRILKPDRGCVWIDDVVLTHMSRRELARRVGYMPQTQEGVNCTVFDAVLLGRQARMAGEPRADDLRKVEEVLRMIRIEHLAMRLTHELSGGELQKVCIARALVQEPRLLLLDEPTSALDLKNQIEIMRLLRRVVDEHGIAAVMTMHDLNKAMRYADTVLMLKNGEIHSYGPTRQVTADMIETVYGLAVEIHHINGYPLVVPREESVH